MKIYFLTFEFPPYFGGGLSTYMEQVSEVYRGKDDEVFIFCVDEKCQEELVEEELSSNVKLIRFRSYQQRYYKEYGYWTAVANEMAQHVAAYSRKYGLPDVIETPDGFGIGYICLQKRLCLDEVFSRIPIVTTAHTPTYMIDRLNDEVVYRLPVYWHGMMEKFSIVACDALVSPSQALLDLLACEVSCELPSNRVIRNPYQPKTTDGVERRRAKAGERDHFYVVSRLCYWKGVDHIVRIFERLWRDGETSKLVLYGDDTNYFAYNCSMSAYLEKTYAHRVEDGLLEIAGKKTRAEINARAQTAYAQIHPSLFDNFPYSVLESMADGQVTIVHNRGGHNELIEHGLNAVKIDVEDQGAAAEQITAVCKMDDRERDAIGERARATIFEACSYEKFYDAKADLINSVIEARTPRKIFPFFSSPAREISPDGAKGIDDRLSVVIPYFNMGAYIEETVESVLNSNYPSIEIIIVDDGSTDRPSIDKLEEIRVRHEEGDNRDRAITIVRTENQGLAGARNTGAGIAKGKLLALLDADDVVREDYYARAIEVLNAYSNVGFVGCWSEDFRDDDGSTIRIWPTFNTELPMQAIFNTTNCQSLVCWKSVFDESGGHDSALRMFLCDWESTIAFLSCGYKGVMIPEALFRYRIRDDGLFKNRRFLWVLNYEKIVRKNQALFDEWGAEIAAFMNANGPNTFYHIPGFPSGLELNQDGHGLPWLKRAYEEGYIDIVKYFSEFMTASRAGRFVRKSRLTQRILEMIARRM